MDGWYPSKLTSGAKRKCFTSEYSKRWKQTEMHNFPACPPQNKLQWYIKQSTIIYRSSSGQKIHRQNRKTWRTHTYTLMTLSSWNSIAAPLELLLPFFFVFVFSNSEACGRRQIAWPVAPPKREGMAAWHDCGKKIEDSSCVCHLANPDASHACAWLVKQRRYVESAAVPSQNARIMSSSLLVVVVVVVVVLLCASRSWHVCVCDHLATMQCVVVVHTNIIPSGSI